VCVTVGETVLVLGNEVGTGLTVPKDAVIDVDRVWVTMVVTDPVFTGDGVRVDPENV
jgi:hypothetical protein